jgi:hypothetical protein
LLYGGARGGGKSSYLLGDFCADAGIGPAWRGILIRQVYPEIDELVRMSQDVIPATWPGSEYKRQERTWRLPTGATLKMRNLEGYEDARAYQGHQHSWIGFDELGNWPDDKAYKALFATLRAAEPVPHKRIRATANPGGPGHHWCRARFVHHAPLGYVPIKDPDTGMLRVFIPAKVTDNQILLARDPGYVDRLKGVGSPELVAAWLSGDWNAIVGSFFSEFSAHHIRRPFAIPRDWLRFRAFDWGSARPFCCLWFAVSDGDVPSVPRGALICYRELYGASEPNVGLRLTVEEVAERIRYHEMADEPITYSVADPAIFTADGGPSMAERFAMKKVYFKPGDNRRVGKQGAAAGWDLVRQRLRGEDDQPMLYIFSTCTNLIRTLPALQHDAARPEDVDSRGEDHAADTLRYACASRPWVRAPMPKVEGLTINRLWELREQQRRFG